MRKPSFDSDYPLETLSELAEEILQDLVDEKVDKSSSVDPGFLSSFYIYPRADALAYVYTFDVLHITQQITESKACAICRQPA